MTFGEPFHLHVCPECRKVSECPDRTCLPDGFKCDHQNKTEVGASRILAPAQAMA